MAGAVWKESKLSLPKFSNPHCDFIDVVWKFWEDWIGSVYLLQPGAFGKTEMLQNLKENASKPRLLCLKLKLLLMSSARRMLSQDR